jgi:cytochrome c556
MAELASDLGSGADAVADAAASRDLPAVVAASARVGAACAHCHVEMRWHEDER